MKESTAKRRRRTGKAKFDRMLRSRVLREHDRRDALLWLAQQARMNANYVSGLLNHTLPRRGSHGLEYVSWRRIKDYLTAEEIRVVESVPHGRE